MPFRPYDVLVLEQAPHAGVVSIDRIACTQLSERRERIARVKRAVQKDRLHGRMLPAEAAVPTGRGGFRCSVRAMDAEPYLRELVRERIERIETVPADQAERLASACLAEVKAAAAALVATGALTEDLAIGEIVDGFSNDLERRGLIERWTVHSLSSFGGLTGRVREIGTIRGAQSAQPIPLRRPDPKIVAVLPLVNDIGSVEGQRVSLISLELWSESLRLRSATTRPEIRPSSDPASHRWTEPCGWEIEDDVGTAYMEMGHSGHGGGRLYISETTFQPAPPESARSLTLIARRAMEDEDAPTPRRFGHSELGEELARIPVVLPQL
jgi:hypothetical protein